MLCVFGFLALSGVAIGCHLFGIGMSHVYKSAEDAVISYDDYWDMYRTCKKLNVDLGIIQATPDSDRQFEQFTKSQRENAIKQNLNRWVEEYNAKSSHIDKRYWKSPNLPHELSVNDFSNYNK
jgi:hypothetical protein